MIRNALSATLDPLAEGSLDRGRLERVRASSHSRPLWGSSRDLATAEYRLRPSNHPRSPDTYLLSDASYRS